MTALPLDESPSTIQPLTLSEAARTAGKPKSTIHRWIRSGKLPAKKLADGSYEISPIALAAVLSGAPGATDNGKLFLAALGASFTPEQQAWLLRFAAKTMLDEKAQGRLRELLEVLSSEPPMGPRARPLIEAAAASLPPEERVDPDRLAGALITNAIDTDDSAPKPLQNLPPVFDDGYAGFPSDLIFRALVRALEDGGKHWTDHRGNTAPTFIQTTNHGQGAVQVSIRTLDGVETPPSAILPKLWQKVQALDDLTSDVLLSVMARWTTFKAGPKEPVWVNADAILDDRGVQRMQKGLERTQGWQHGHRAEDRLAVGKALAQLQDVWLQVINVDMTPGKRRRGRNTLNLASSRALAMLDINSQVDLDGKAVFLQARVMPGIWAEAFWDLGIRQTGLIAQKALAYDPTRERIEKRLAKYLAFQYRLNAGRADTVMLRVATLLENCGLEPDRRNPVRTSDRLEAALDRLQHDRVLARWAYADPEARNNLPARAWLDEWLAMVITIDFPEELAEHYSSLGQGPAALPPATD